MTQIVYAVLASLVAITLGAAAAWLTRDAPPAAAAAPTKSAVQVAKISTPETQRPTAAPPDAATPRPQSAPKAQPKPKKAKADEEASKLEVKVPKVANKLADDDSDLLPRSDGALVTLNLSAVGLSQLRVRRGALDRDGPAHVKRWAKAPVVATLKGPRVQVYALHFGYNAEAEVVAMHVRLHGEPGREGMVSLLHQGALIPLRVARQEP